jgi:16S rRNA (uracil1498-N3)-methyltransferase
VLEGEPHHYLAKVLRLRRGDAIAVFDGLGHEIESRILDLDARTTTLLLGERRTAAPPCSVRITLFQAVPRGERMDMLVQKTTELGVTRIVPVVVARSVVRPAINRLGRWQTIAREAARQCGRADVPDILAPVALRQALEGEAASLRDNVRLLLDENESPERRPLRHALSGTDKTVALLVGPEGGLAPEENELARAHGFVPVGVGPRVLRVETAAIVAVALVQASGGGLD